MAECVEDSRVEFGVLFVGGIGKERPGSAVSAFAASMYRWLFRWNRGTSLSEKPSPVLHDAVLSPADGDDGDPAHVTLEVPLRLKKGTRQGNWLLAESSWADVSALPRFVLWTWRTGSGRYRPACWCCSSSFRCAVTGSSPRRMDRTRCRYTGG